MYQVTLERDNLQNRIEQQKDERKPIEWINLLGYNKIEDHINIIATIMKNLAPLISFFQYYQAYKPIIFKCSSLPDI